MANTESIGERLKRLRARSGLSLREVAAAMGVGHSSIQGYFEPGYKDDGGYLPLETAMQFAVVFTGKGNPPITKEEVLALTGLPQVAAGSHPGYTRMSYEVAEALAEVTARIALEGKEPPADVVEAIAKTLAGLSALYEHDHTARVDPAQTRGALKALAQQFAPPRRQ